MGKPDCKVESSAHSRRTFLSSTAFAFTALAFQPNWSFAKRSEHDDLAGLTIEKASSLIHNRKISPVDLTESCLARIEKYNPLLNAFITVNSEQALSRARTAETEIARGSWRGPLHGIPIALKDNIDTAGIRTTAGSAIFADRIPEEDAEVVRRLMEAGAVLLGKLNMQEFAWGASSVISYWGPVHNPWALDREAGGSSGGSGAAVAADLCYGALGTDTGGSIRIPATHCGIVGLMPTYGRASIRGIIPNCWSLDHVGPMCKTVGDAALMLQTIAGYDPEDISSVDMDIPDFTAALSQRVESFRLGIPRNVFFDNLDSEVEKVFETSSDVIRPMVKSIRDVTLPSILDMDHVGAEAYAYHRPHLRNADRLYQPSTRKSIKSLGSLDAADYVLARRALVKIRREVRQVFEEIDLLITPTLKYTPQTIEHYIEQAKSEEPMSPRLSNTWHFNVLGLPAITVPCGFTDSGLPIGLQIAGAPFAEGTVLALAQAYQESTEWHLHKPKLPERI